MDIQKPIIKCDAIVPLTGDFIRGPIRPSMEVAAITSTAATYTFPVSNLGKFITWSDTQACAFSLPAASSVSAYWSVAPGDAFSTTVLNIGTVAATFAADTVLGVGTTMSHTTMASGSGYTFKYVIGGTIATPTAAVYIQ